MFLKCQFLFPVLVVIFNIKLTNSDILKTCRVTNLKATLQSPNTGIFQWQPPALKLDTVGYDITLLAVHKDRSKEKDKQVKTILKLNRVPAKNNSITKNDLKICSCLEYKFIVETSCRVVKLIKLPKNSKGQTAIKRTKVIRNGPPVETKIHASNSQPFKSVTFDMYKNATLNITLEPSPTISLCRPEYSLKIFRQPKNDEIDNDSSGSSAKMHNVIDITVVNETSIIINRGVNNETNFHQCGNYLMVIKLLDPKAYGIEESVPFLFDYRDDSDTDWSVNNFIVNASGPDWIFLTWERPINHSQCVKIYHVRGYTKNGSLLNNTYIKADVFQFNATRENGYNMRPCSMYHFVLLMKGKKIRVNGTVNGTTATVAPGEIKGLDVENITSNSMAIFWSKPDVGIECATYYSIDFNNKYGAMPTVKVNLDEDTYILMNLNACNEYIIGVRTKGVKMDSERVVINKTTTAEVPGAVETFTKSHITTSSTLLSWTRPIKYPDCVTYYNLSWYDHSDNFVNRIILDDPIVHDYKIEGLKPCLTYKFSVISGGTTGRSQETYVNVTMSEEVPGPVRDIAIRRGDFQLLVVWAPPNTAVECVVDYKVKYRVLNGTHFAIRDKQRDIVSSSQIINISMSDPITTKILIDLAACVDYEVTITALSPSGHESLPVSTTQTTFPYVFSKPSGGKLLNVSQEWVLFQWMVPYTNRNQCPMDLFTVSCNDESGESFTYETTSRNQFGIVIMNITGLRPYKNYSCISQAENVAGISKSSVDLMFQTLQAEPTKPKKVRVIRKMSTMLEMAWDKPEIIPGVLEGYNVSVKCSDPLYPVPDNCVVTSMKKSYSVKLPGAAENVLLKGLSPYQKCRITVAAATGAGYGPSSEPVNTLTLPNVSEIIRNLSVEVSFNKSMISWYPPCISNGIIANFSIRVMGTRKRYVPDNIGTWNISYDNDQLYVQNLFDLPPDYKYKVTIRTLVEGVHGSVPATTQFVSSSRIPEEPSPEELLLINPDPKGTDLPSEQALINLTNTLFSSEKGEIKYYAVLIAEYGYLGPPQSGLLMYAKGKIVWPKVNTWANATHGLNVLLYQTTPAFWRPFNEGSLVPEIIQYVIGSEECSKDAVDVYCNGPLRPATSYKLRIRAFTSAGFRDSPALLFSTDPAFPYVLLMKCVLCLFLILSFLIFVLFSILRKYTWNKVKTTPSKPEDKYSNITNKKYLKDLSTKKFLLRCNELLSDDEKMKAEFTRLGSLSSQIDLVYSVAQLPGNKKKNRYINVLPYDSTRVVLTDSPDSDYINASYIRDDLDQCVQYIACQAPMDDTCVEFWKMIYQCKVQSIVMLCNYREQGKVKCYGYIPDQNETLSFGDMVIMCSQKKVYPLYTERTLSLTKEEQDVCTAVTHFHFNDWPDFGVPSEPDTMLRFCKTVQAASVGNGLVAVHCSAGVGRTGTYIAVDLILRQIERNKKINVFKTVLRLREQRANMVQTESQYSYIYKCIKHVLEDSSKCPRNGSYKK